jgi:hypothetical protein
MADGRDGIVACWSRRCRVEAAVRNLYIQQGADYRKIFRWKTNGSPHDISGFVARMHVRPSVDSAQVLLALTTENDRVVLGGAAGTILLQIPHSITRGLWWLKAVYDLEMIASDGYVTRFLRGEIAIGREVTRESV